MTLSRILFIVFLFLIYFLIISTILITLKLLANFNKLYYQIYYLLKIWNDLYLYHSAYYLIIMNCNCDQLYDSSWFLHQDFQLSLVKLSNSQHFCLFFVTLKLIDLESSLEMRLILQETIILSVWNTLYSFYASYKSWLSTAIFHAK